MTLSVTCLFPTKFSKSVLKRAEEKTLGRHTKISQAIKPLKDTAIIPIFLNKARKFSKSMSILTNCAKIFIYTVPKYFSKKD